MKKLLLLLVPLALMAGTAQASPTYTRTCLELTPATSEGPSPYPLGWPCKPFKNPTRVISYMKAKLIYNGFRPNMTVRLLTTRQIRFTAVQDGQRYIVNVARSDVRQIKVAVICATQYCTGATTAKFNLGFDA